MIFFSTHHYTNQRGFTLVELAIVLAIAAMVLVMFLSMAQNFLTMARSTATENKMVWIAQNLATFAIQNNRLPCPATPDGSGGAPFGFERGSNADGDDRGSCRLNNDVEGIIPFRTLGLVEDDIRDGWGNLITYRISPVFAINPDDVTVAQYNTVHAACLTRRWFEGEGRTDRYRNPDKARFCCPMRRPVNYAPNTDLILNDENGDLIWPLERTNAGVVYQEMDDIDPNDQSTLDLFNNYGNNDDPLTDDRLLENQAIAYVLISHGRNEYGAYDGIGVNTRIAFNGAPPIPVDELENQNNDNGFVRRVRDDTEGATYFDDIILWRTQHQVMSEFGGASCARP